MSCYMVVNFKERRLIWQTHFVLSNNLLNAKRKEAFAAIELQKPVNSTTIRHIE